jgi:hypothetical protein
MYKWDTALESVLYNTAKGADEYWFVTQCWRSYGLHPTESSKIWNIANEELAIEYRKRIAANALALRILNA